MKKIFILVVLLTGLLCNSQTQDTKNGVEININIYQRYDANNLLVSSSMGVTITNHTGKKIYIPNMRSYCTPFIYKKVAGLYSEMQNIGIKMAEEVYSNLKGLPPKRNDDFDPVFDSRGKKIITNTISDIIHPERYLVAEQKQVQFQLARDSASFSSPEKLQIVKPYIVDNNIKIKHLTEDLGFLKPNEVLESISISEIDQIKDTKGDYKIFVDTVAIKKILETKRMFYPYPAEFYHDIMGYELFLPENMTSNVVYITIL
jgi:hypothetical protein